MYIRSQPSRSSTSQFRGSTIAEMVVAIFLTALLAMLMATTAVTFARPAAEVDGRTRLALEASLAAEALARDLSGYLADNSGNPGKLTQYQFILNPNTNPSTYFMISQNGTMLTLTYQASPESQVIVTYQQENNELVRTLGNQTVVVARHVTKFDLSLCNSDGTSNPTNGSSVQIAITLTYPDPPSNRLPSFTATYVLIGEPPPQWPTQ